jgi:hypothetical protein
MAEQLFNPSAYIEASNIRPATFEEQTFLMVVELLKRCDSDMVRVHIDQVQKIMDDLQAVNTYCWQELYAIDAAGQRQDEQDLRNAGCN